MRKTSEADQKHTLSAKLTHPDLGDVGQGKLTFGYSCSATFSFDGFEPKVRPTGAQLAEGLVAEAEDWTKWSLFGCKGYLHMNITLRLMSIRKLSGLAGDSR